MKTLVLIDGNAIIHRAYHSIPKTLSTRSGEHTNAVYGFATTMIRVLEDLKPDYIAAAFDLAGPTFRHEAYADYKATRVKADQELYDQIPRVKELVSTMGIPIYELQGYEADDILGTIVSKIRDPKLEIRNNVQKSKNNETIEQPVSAEARADAGLSNVTIFIVSGDKDIFQLINGGVKVYNLKRGLSETQIVDEETIKKLYNLDPADFIDLKALAGDASDNIPGVPGIGPKTATSLLQDFDTLDKIYQQIAKLLNCSIVDLTTKQFNNETVDRATKQMKTSPRIIRLLIDNKDQAFLSQKLATIHKDVPIEFSLDEMKWGEYDKDKLRALFEELGFRSLLRRFGAGDENPKNQISNDKQSPKSKVQKNDDQLKLL